MARRRFRALRWRWGGDVTFRRADHAGTERRNDFPGRGDVTFRRARTTRERNGEIISRGEAMSPFDARTTRERDGEMISRGEATSPFDARALDFFGPLRGAGILKSIPLGEPIPIYGHLIF